MGGSQCTAAHRQHGGRHGGLLATLHQRRLGVHLEANHVALGSCKASGGESVTNSCLGSVRRMLEEQLGGSIYRSVSSAHKLYNFAGAMRGRQLAARMLQRPEQQPARPTHLWPRRWHAGSRGPSGSSRRAGPAGSARPGPGQGRGEGTVRWRRGGDGACVRWPAGCLGSAGKPAQRLGQHRLSSAGATGQGLPALAVKARMNFCSCCCTGSHTSRG